MGSKKKSVKITPFMSYAKHPTDRSADELNDFMLNNILKEESENYNDESKGHKVYESDSLAVVSPENQKSIKSNDENVEQFAKVSVLNKNSNTNASQSNMFKMIDRLNVVAGDQKEEKNEDKKTRNEVTFG